MSDVSLRILMSAQSGNTLGVIGDVARTLGSTGLGGALALVGAAAAGVAVAVGVTATKAAATFQSGLSSLVTGAGESVSNLQLVSNGILDLATATGTTTQQLIDGLFMIESAGYRGAAGLAVLKAAAEGAKAQNADLGTVADATTTIMTDFASSGITASQAVNTLIAIVQNGKTHMQDLAASMSQVLPTASAVQVHLNDVAGAMATITGHGVPAANAATYLRQMLISLSAPAAAGAKSLADIGLTTQQVSDDMKKSLPDTLNLIMQHLAATYTVGSPQYITALKNIAGGSKQMQGMLDLTGTSLQTFYTDVSKVSGAVQQGGASINGWAVVQQDFNFKLSQLSEVVQTLLIRLGTGLLPVVTSVAAAILPVITNFATWVTNGKNLQGIAEALHPTLSAVAGAFHLLTGTIIPLIAHLIRGALASGGLQTAFGIIATVVPVLIGVFTKFVAILAGIANWFANNQTAFTAFKLLMIALGVAVGVLLAAALATVVIGMAAVALAIGVVVAPILGIIWLVQHWGQIWGDVVGFVKGLWQGFTDWLGNTLKSIGAFFSDVWDGILDGLHTAWDAILGALQAALGFLVNLFTLPFRAIGALFSWLYNHNYYFKDLVDAIRRIVAAGLAWLQGAWHAAITWLTNLWHSIAGIATTVWSTVTSAIKGAVTTAWNWLVGVWNTVIGWLSAQWNKLAGFATTAWNAVVGVFKGVWGSISGALSDLWNNLSGWFGKLATQALTWGKNLITGFINGIKNMAGDVGKAVGDIAGTVGKFLGFHSPAKEGPGAEADVWAPNLIKMFAQGLTNALPTLQTSLNMVMRPVGNTLSGQGLPAPSFSRPGANTSYGGHTFNINFASNVPPSQQQVRQIVDWIEPELGRRVRSQAPGYSSGGVF